jgi:hypothetical protein
MKHSLNSLIALGFDRSSNTFGLPNRFSVACSQCQSLVINGTPTHETGCPNAMHECHGCNATIPLRQKYCSDCR